MHDPNPTLPDENEAAPAASPAVVAILVENHRQFLAFLEPRVGSREAAEDLLQEAFVRGLTRGGEIRSDESAVAWFYRLLRNALIDRWRRQDAEGRALERAASMAEIAVPAADHALWSAVCGCVTSLIATLKPEYAEIIRRVDIEDEMVSEAARALGVTANLAGVRLHRARQALRRRLVESCGTCTTHGCLDCHCPGAPPGAP